MPSRTPTQVVQALFDALDARDVEQATRLIHPSYRGVDVTRSALTLGREEMLEGIRTGLLAFSESSFSVHRCIADPPRVTVFWTLNAAHTGTFLQIPATHQSVSVGGAGLFTVQDARIVEAMHLWDFAGLLRAMGLLPDLPVEEPHSGSS